MVTLRLATRVEHDRIEMIFDLPRLLKSVDAYRQTLESFHAALRALSDLEPAYEALAIESGTIRRLTAIIEDLKDLDGDLNGTTATEPPRLNPAQRVGALYVIEGSALGGQIICQGLRGHFGPDTPVRFFAGLEKKTGAHWREFGQALDRFVLTYDCMDDVIDGARQMFHFMANSIEGGRPTIA